MLARGHTLVVPIKMFSNTRKVFNVSITEDYNVPSNTFTSSDQVVGLEHGRQTFVIHNRDIDLGGSCYRSSIRCKTKVQ